MHLKHTFALAGFFFATAVYGQLSDQNCVRFVNEKWPRDADWLNSLFVLNFPREDSTFRFPFNEPAAERLNHYKLRPALALGSSVQSKLSEWMLGDHRNYPSNRRTTEELFYLTPALDMGIYKYTRNNADEHPLVWSRGLSYRPGKQGNFFVADVTLAGFKHRRKAPTNEERKLKAAEESSADGVPYLGREGTSLISDWQNLPPSGYARLFKRNDDHDLIHFWDAEWRSAQHLPAEQYPSFVREPGPPLNFVPQYHDGVFLCDLPRNYAAATDKNMDDPETRLAPYYLRLGNTPFYNYVTKHNGGPENCQHGHLQLCNAGDLDIPEEYYPDDDLTDSEEDSMFGTPTAAYTGTQGDGSARRDSMIGSRLDLGTGEREEGGVADAEAFITITNSNLRPVRPVIRIDDEADDDDVWGGQEQDDGVTYTHDYDEGSGFEDPDREAEYSYSHDDDPKVGSRTSFGMDVIDEAADGKGEEVKKDVGAVNNPIFADLDMEDMPEDDDDDNDDEEIIDREVPRK